MERETGSSQFPLGSRIPKFSLKDVSGATIDQTYLDGAKAALVVFSCNHCPYVKGSDADLTEVIRRFQPQGLKAVSISANDATQYPEDSFEKMQEKASALELPHPYLYDETQSVAKAFDAACTPEIYLFNAEGKLVFHGPVNDSPRDPTKVTRRYLNDAIEAVLDGRSPEKGFISSIGCSIKWKR